MGPEVEAQAALGLTLSPCSLVCTALRGKLGVFSEMEANFKVCGPSQLIPWASSASSSLSHQATLLCPRLTSRGRSCSLCPPAMGEQLLNIAELFDCGRWIDLGRDSGGTLPQPLGQKADLPGSLPHRTSPVGW